MGFLDSILGGGIGKIFDGVKGIIGQFKLAPEEKAKLDLEIYKLQQESEKMIEASYQSELEAKKSIIVAELSQGDNFTKRMRPSLGYFGMGVILFNYCIVPLIAYIRGEAPKPFELPTEFWVAWGGMMATYTVGRTMEKRGITNQFTKIVTGK